MKRILSYRVLIAFLIAFAIYNVGGFESSDIMIGVVFAVVYYTLGHIEITDNWEKIIMIPKGILGNRKNVSSNDVEEQESADRRTAYEKRIFAASSILSFIWTGLYMLYIGNRVYEGLTNPLFRAVYFLITMIGVYLGVAVLLRQYLIHVTSELKPDDRSVMMPDYPWNKWIKYTIIIFLCLLPLFLLNYPGTMTVDSFEQLSQAMGRSPYTDHHPWVHTMLIKAFFSMGYIIKGNVYDGIAAYSIIQMVIMSMSIAYAVAALAQIGLTAKGRVSLILAYVLYPYNLVYSMTMWKDVIFSACVLVLSVAIFRMACDPKPEGWSKTKTYDAIVYVLAGLGMCLLRHNGFYAYILTAIVMVITMIKRYRKSAKTIVTVAGTVFVILVSLIIKGPVQKAYNVTPGDYAHAIPIPLQQVARVVYEDRYLTNKDKELLNAINDIDFLKTEYTPGGADPVMQWVVFGDSDRLLEQKSEYIRLYIRLGFKYPLDYIRAYIDQTKGYYTTMQPEQTEYYGIMPNDEGLDPQPVIGSRIRVKVNEITFKLHNMIPLYGILYSMGASFMLWMLAVATVLIRKTITGEPCRITAYIPALSVMLTLFIATPLVADLRYAYPLMISLPTLIAISVKK